MKRYPVILMLIVLMFGALVTTSGCREAEKVSHNVSQEADNFNVTRRLVVTNVSMVTSPTVLYELVGNFSINTDNIDRQLEVVCEVHRDDKVFYTKHFVMLNEYVTYVVEDLSGADVSPYKYELNFLPESIVPVSIVSEP